MCCCREDAGTTLSACSIVTTGMIWGVVMDVVIGLLTLLELLLKLEVDCTTCSEVLGLGDVLEMNVSLG